MTGLLDQYFSYRLILICTLISVIPILILGTWSFYKTRTLLKSQALDSIISGIWQGFGWNSIIYLAAITSINVELFESARLDGCTRFQEIIYITLPSIAPTIIILLILRFGSMMSIGFEKVYLLYNPRNYEVSDVISTYVYRAGITNAQFSFSTAVDLFNSVINLILLLTVNRISRSVSEISLF